MRDANAIEEQACFCSMLMDRLLSNVSRWCDSGCECSGYDGANGGACKTAISQDIVRLRRELLELGKMVER